MSERDEARKTYDRFMREVEKFNKEVKDNPEVRSYWENRSSTEHYDFVEELRKYDRDNEQKLENCVKQPVMLAGVNSLQSKLLSIREIAGNLRKSLIGGDPMEDIVEGCVNNVAYGISSCDCIADEIRTCLIDLYDRIGEYGDKW